MTKTAKNKEVLGQLLDLVTKQASAPKPTATGVPGKEPNSGAVSEKHDKVNQNAVGPETNTPQHHEQKPSTDEAKPTGGAAKKAEETPAAPASEANVSVEKLGKDILELVQKFANNPVATGVPSKDPQWKAVSEKHDTVNQNAVGPESNNPQAHSQKPATDSAVPVAHAKSAEEQKAESDKTASFELGRLWGELVLKKAYDEQLEQVKEAGRRDFELLVSHAAEQLEQVKEAGRRDFELLVSHAAEQMKQASRKPIAKVASEAEAEKRAEAEGAAAFQNLYKEAQIEQALGQVLAQNEALAAKIAEFEKAASIKEAEHKAALAAKQAELDRREAEEREQQKFAALASLIEQRIADRLRSEIIGGK